MSAFAAVSVEQKHGVAAAPISNPMPATMKQKCKSAGFDFFCNICDEAGRQLYYVPFDTQGPGADMPDPLRCMECWREMDRLQPGLSLAERVRPLSLQEKWQQTFSEELNAALLQNVVVPKETVNAWRSEISRLTRGIEQLEQKIALVHDKVAQLQNESDGCNNKRRRVT